VPSREPSGDDRTRPVSIGPDVIVRAGAPEDRQAIEALYPLVFPDEDLLPLVRQLLDMPDATVSLVAVAGDNVIGHVLFTRCDLDGRKVALLGPLGIDPVRQRKGLGAALVRAGHDRLRDAACEHVFVLGDPAYYGRFGFRSEPGVATPCPIPDEWRAAWQSLDLAGHGRAPRGRLAVPEPWRDPALWSP
jgi:putative acetyltransferase